MIGRDELFNEKISSKEKARLFRKNTAQDSFLTIEISFHEKASVFIREEEKYGNFGVTFSLKF